MKKTFILCLTLLSFLFSQSQVRYLKGILQGSQEAPTKTETSGSGVVIVKYDMATKRLELYGDYAGLTKPITGSHIHRGEPGVAGPIVTPLTNTGDTTGALSVIATLTQLQEDSLLAGNMYANVHSETYPNGELRAQLTLASEQTTFLSGKLQGAQEVPPTTSTATGSVYAIIDMNTDSVFLTGSYSGLTKASTDAHVHLADPGSAGDILFPIHHSFESAGAVHAMTTVTPQNALQIVAGRTYVNIHTSTFPNGEIRAQLLNNTGVRYLAGNMSNGSEEPNTSAARGTVIVVYNAETNELRLAGDYQKLSDAVTNAYLEAPGSASSTIQLTTSGDSTGTITLATTITDEQETDLLAGNMYVNVQDAKYPGGEIRTQLVATTSGETHLFTVNLTTGQVVKPKISESSAGANALIIVDKTTGLTYVTGAFQGINSTAVAAGIHRGAVGDTASVILPLSIAQRTPVPHSGTFSGSATLSAALVDSMISGLTYIDVRSSHFTYGAMRGQLGDLVLPIKLTYFNAYKQRNQVELIWETSEEINVSRYEIEQLNATDKNWVTKGSVLSHGGTGAAKYSFTDIPNTSGGKYAIYRLKITDKDGKITYSSIVKLNYEKLKAELFIQTNPVANGELHYSITGLSTGKKAEVSIIDYNGRLILKNVTSSIINNTLKIPHLSAGLYKLVVRVDDTVLQQTFMK